MSRERAEASAAPPPVSRRADARDVPTRSHYSKFSDPFPKSNPSVRKSTTGALMTSDRGATASRSRECCAYCGEGHFSDKCSAFPTYDDRRKRLNSNCLGCLRPGHHLKDCPDVKVCAYCKKDRSHHRSLCLKKFPKGPGSHRVSNDAAGSASLPTADVAHPTVSTTAAENTLVTTGENVLLQTAFVTVSSVTSSTSSSSRLLFDSGSQRSYISASLAAQLKLKPVSRGRLSIFTFGSKQPREIVTTLVELKLQLLDGSYVNIFANVVPTITGGVQRMPIDLSTPLVKQLPLADKPPREAEVSAIDLLIGSDYYHDLITSEKIELKRGLYLIGSKLGWIVCGRQMAGPNKVVTSTILFVQSKFIHDDSLLFSNNDSQLMERFNLSQLWELDTIGIKDHAKDIGDDEALRAFHGSIRYEEGRYAVKWSWKANGIDLPTNYSLALGRLKSLLRRYSSQPEVLAQYQAVLDDQLRKGIIEPVVGQNVEQQYRVHYIPHHAVITPQKESTKLRIVYDASAKARKENMSLNECLYRGPILLDDLAALLVRFTLNETAIVAKSDGSNRRLWTRWKLDEKKNRITDPSGKPILQVVAIKRADCGEWAIPGGFINAGELFTTALKREFGEEALASVSSDAANKLFQRCVEIYVGYIDSHRNTDNAWMETMAYNYHDEMGDLTDQLTLKAGDDADDVKWMDIDSGMTIIDPHKDWLKQVVKRRKAHWGTGESFHH